MPLFKGIDYAVGTNWPGASTPIVEQQSVRCVRVDLADPDVQLFATPRASGYVVDSRETLSLSVSNFLKNYGVKVAADANFYNASVGGSDPTAEGISTEVFGLQISAGSVVSVPETSTPDPRYASLLFTTNKQPILAYNNRPPGTNTAGIYTAVTGFYPVLSNGLNIGAASITNYPDASIHQAQPRTAFGVSQDRRYLFLMTIDGRQSGYSDGALDSETALWMLQFGAWDAINMDGGGSTAMYRADSAGNPVPLNHSSYVASYGRERFIGSHLGVFAQPLPSFVTNLAAVPGVTNATITWTTISNATSQVEYGLTTNYGTLSVFDPTLVTNHSVTLSGLTSATTYFFRAISTFGTNRYTAASKFQTTNFLLPMIVQQPTNTALSCGSNATLLVVAQGTPPLTYQWLANNAPLSGATNASLLVTHASLTQNGNLYSVWVSNSAGSVLSATALLSVFDVTPPIITCPSSISTNAPASQCSAVVSFTATATDNCDPAPVIACSPASGSAFPVGITVVSCVTWDASGNTNHCSFSVTVLDTTPPTILYLTNAVLVADGNGQARMPDLTGSNYLVAVDNCSSVTVTQSVGTNTLLGLGANLVVLGMVDGSGNTTYATNFVLVEDKTPPTIICPAGVAANTDTGQCSAVVGFTVTVMDNSDPAPGLVCSPASGAVFPVGVTVVGCVTWDASGNTNQCSFSVTVRDTTPPTILYLTNAVLVADGNGQAPMPDLTGSNYLVAVDNCSSVTATQSVGTNTLLALGTNPVVLGMVDGSGNVAYATNFVLVEDRTPPTIICPADIAENTDAGQCSAVVGFTVTATDNSDPAPGIVCSPASGSVFPVGITVVSCVTWDASDNTNQCSFSVTVRDTTPPSIIYLTNAVLVADGNGQARMPDVTGSNYLVAMDNCSSVTVTQSVGTDTVLALGTNLVVLGVLDGSGNVAYATNFVLVEDRTPPTINCPADVAVNADTGQCSSVVGFTVTATGNSDPAPGVVCSPASGSVFPVGMTVVNCVTWDASDNTNQCSFSVTVWDATPPSILYLTNAVVVADGTGQAPMPDVTGSNYLVAVDNCSSVTVTQSVGTNTLLGLGANLVVLGMVDGAGNVAYATNFVLVQDRTPPTIICPADIAVNTDAGQCSAVVSFTVTATDNSDPVPGFVCSPAFGSIFPVGMTVVSCVTWDVSGNTNNCSFTVTVKEPLPVITQQPQSGTNVQGTDAVFNVAVTSCGETSYQWWLGTNALPGETNAILAITNVQFSSAGAYSVVVGNSAGSITSAVAMLVVAAVQPPRVQSVTVPTTAGEPVLISFFGLAGQSYTVLYRSGLVSGPWLPVTNVPTLGANQLVTVQDSPALGQPERFYRIITPALPP